MTTNIDVTLHPSGWYIFEPRFLVQSIQLARQQIDKNFPKEVPTTEDKELDRLIPLQPAKFWLNVAQMAELCYQGYPLSLVNYQDSLPVYTYVQNHLEQAMKVLVNSLNSNQAPLDDLMILEEFASRVFAHARYLMPKSDGANASLISGLNLSGLGQISIFKAAMKTATVQEDDGYPKRQSFTGQIAQLQTQGITDGTYSI
jgi:hypothetical protein